HRERQSRIVEEIGHHRWRRFAWEWDLRPIQHFHAADRKLSVQSPLDAVAILAGIDNHLPSINREVDTALLQRGWWSACGDRLLPLPHPLGNHVDRFLPALLSVLELVPFRS